MPECFCCRADASVGEVAIWLMPAWIWVRDAFDQWDEATNEWEQRPEAIWDRPNVSIETCDIYCRSCWEDWGQHVKFGLGRRYALNRACEELAVQTLIHLVDPPRGNLFYCPPCQRSFQSASSLENHLRESHNQPLQRLDNLLPAVYISSCNDETVSESIKGKYVAKRWHHGKPLYQKDAICSERKVFIHFWDHRDGEDFHGWWITFDKLGGETWAYNSSSLCLNPPQDGWRVPWSGAIDQALAVTTLQPTEEQKGIHFGLRWEFVASSNGEAIDWRPMKKAMNDALEQRWEQGWQGDDGTETFYVRIGHLTYGIDCHTMEQWNAKTHRRRQIRRGEERSDVSALMCKLAQKHVEVESLQTEKNKLVEEKNELQNERDAAMEETNLLVAKIEKLEFLGVDVSSDAFYGFYAFSECKISQACKEEKDSDQQTVNHQAFVLLQACSNPNAFRKFQARANSLAVPVGGGNAEMEAGAPWRKPRFLHAHASRTKKLITYELMMSKKSLSRPYASFCFVFASSSHPPRQEKRVLLQNSGADHATQMILQEAWRMNRQMQTNIYRELPPWDAAFSQIQQALVEACPVNHYGDCKRARDIKILGLQQVCNIRTWKAYEFRKEEIRKELESRGSVPTITSTLSSEVCRWAHLDSKINEVLLLHGTRQIDQIAEFGFDQRLARESGLYGQGIYFTDHSCKSLQYSGADPRIHGSPGHLIIARVILGHPHNAAGPLKQLKVEPMVDPNDSSKGRCHSVIVQPGILKNSGLEQVHREFVLFNGAQAYPEMIVHFEIS